MNTRKNTKKLTVSAVLCALTLVLMLSGSIVEVMDLSVGAVASFAVIFAVLELGGAYPMLIWSVGSVLGMLLLPNKLPAIYYLLFFGWYPIVKRYLERLPMVFSWIAKCAACAASLTLICLISVYFAGVEDIIPMSVWVYVVVLPVFVIYDIALTRLISAYLHVWRHKLKIKI